MSKVSDVIFSVFSEIKDELVSPSLVAWMADFLTALIEFIVSTYWEDILFSTNVFHYSRFTIFSSMRFLSSLIRSAMVLVAFVGWESLFDFGIFKAFLYKNNFKLFTVSIWVCYIQYCNFLSLLLQWYLWIDRGGLLWMLAAEETSVKPSFSVTQKSKKFREGDL